MTRAATWLVLAAFVAVLLFMQIRLATNVDVVFIIIAGQKIWAGLNYPDGIRDINPPLLPAAKAERVRRLDADLKGGLAADMAKFRPKFIFVEIGAEVSGVEDVDILKYFLADRAVADQ